MLDIKFIRENKEALQQAIKNKKIDLDLDQLLFLDEERISLMQKIEGLKAQKNELNKFMKQGTDKKELVERGKKIKEQQAKLEPKLKEIKQQFEELMVKVPTIPAPDTPPGQSDEQNIEIFKSHEPQKFAFKPLDHIELAKKLDIIDFERGTKVAGYRGYYLKNEGTMLVMALMMYVMQKLIKYGFTPMIPPTLIKQFPLFGSGYFKGLEYNDETDEIYQIASSDKDVSGKESLEKKFLVGTAEPSLLAYYAGEVLEESQLPIKICGFSQCYRSEIGSYGRDTKGLYRVHEFFKVEQVILSKADIEESDKLQQEMLKITEEIHQELGLPYRILRICLGDLGIGKYKQFDIEAWMPGSGRWGETGSASNFLDWQARRLNVKYIDKEGNKKFVFMLNNTAAPSPRPLIAILENFQQEDGSVIIPEVLRKYTGFDKI